MKYLLAAAGLGGIVFGGYLLWGGHVGKDLSSSPPRVGGEVPETSARPDGISGVKASTEPLPGEESAPSGGDAWFAYIANKRKAGLPKADYLGAWSRLVRKDAPGALKAWASFPIPETSEAGDVGDILAEALHDRGPEELARLLTPDFDEKRRATLAGIIISQMPAPEGLRLWELLSDKLGDTRHVPVEISRRMSEMSGDAKTGFLNSVLASPGISSPQMTYFVESVMMRAGDGDLPLIDRLINLPADGPLQTAAHNGLEKGLMALDMSHPQIKEIAAGIINGPELDFALGSSMASAFGRWTLKSPIAVTEFLSQHADSPNADYMIAGFVQAYKEIDAGASDKWLKEIRNGKIRELAVGVTMYQN